MIGSDAVPFTDPHGFACVSVGVGELVDPLAGVTNSVRCLACQGRIPRSREPRVLVRRAPVLADRGDERSDSSGTHGHPRGRQPFGSLGQL